jgi:5-methylcytosine-specific restriction protein A
MASENDTFAQQLIPKIELVPSREWLNSYLDLVKQVLEITGLKDNDPRLSMPLLPDKNSSLHVSINARYVIALRKKKVNGQFALFIGSIFTPYYRDIPELSQNEQVYIDWRFKNLIGETTETPIFLLSTSQF